MRMGNVKIAMLHHIRRRSVISLFDLCMTLFGEMRYGSRSALHRLSSYLMDLHSFDLIRIEIKDEQLSDHIPKGEPDSAERYREEEIMDLSGFIARDLCRCLDDDFSRRRSYDPRAIHLSVTGHFESVREALGISISELYRYEQEKIQRNRFFGWSEPELGAKVFVITPFADKMCSVYEKHIKSVCEELGYSCMRGDEVDRFDVVIHDVWNLINNAEIIICDCTGKNPNVFYELGIAHAVGKRVICITQNEEDIPFDIRQFRYLVYRNTPKGLMEFERSLKRILEANL